MYDINNNYYQQNKNNDFFHNKKKFKIEYIYFVHVYV